MIKASEVASRLGISNEQVMSLVDFGYLKVSDLLRVDKGFSYLFDEEEVAQIDLAGSLAEIEEMRRAGRTGYARRRSRYAADISSLRQYDRFLASIETTPCPELLRAAFFLFHLNHYAKTYRSAQDELYALKHQVLKVMVERYGIYLSLTCLIGGDRFKVWLCDDCRSSAREQGISFTEYIRRGQTCPNCYHQIVERDFYSLLEIVLSVEEHRFTFHAPFRTAREWDLALDALPQRERAKDDSLDQMRLYGRPVSRTEERVFPLPMVIEELEDFLRR